MFSDVLRIVLQRKGDILYERNTLSTVVCWIYGWQIEFERNGSDITAGISDFNYTDIIKTEHTTSLVCEYVLHVISELVRTIVKHATIYNNRSIINLWKYNID